jgi:hypothetical protein
LLTPRPGFGEAGSGSGCEFAARLATAGSAALDEPPINPEKRVAINTTATITSENAAMTLFRFSAPTFTYVVLK